MARIRSIKPSIWSDQRFCDLSLQARLLCLGMISNADDDGRLIATGAALAGTIFPHDDLNPKTVEKWRDEINKTGLIVVYKQGRGTYAHFPNWTKHQFIRKHMPSTLPNPDNENVPPGAVSGAVPGDAPPTTRVRTSRARGTERDTDTEADTEWGRAVALTPPDPTGQLLAEHANAYTDPPPPSALSPVKAEISRLVAEHVPPDRIRAGLARMRERRLSPRLLPQLVTEAATVLRPSTTDAAVAQGLALIEKFSQEPA